MSNGGAGSELRHGRSRRGDRELGGERLPAACGVDEGARAGVTYQAGRGTECRAGTDADGDWSCPDRCRLLVGVLHPHGRFSRADGYHGR